MQSPIPKNTTVQMIDTDLILTERAVILFYFIFLSA